MTDLKSGGVCMGGIEQYYNYDYDEWGRLLRHRIEFEMTKRMLDRFIKEKSTVLDVGGGPGRYSIYLAQNGHEVTFISSYAPIVDCLKDYPQNIRQMKDSLLKFLDDGRHDSRFNIGFTDAYFFNPDHIESFMSKFNLRTLRTMAVEGLGAMVEEKLMQLPEVEFQNWLDVFEVISESPVVWGSCEHLLYIGQKKK